MGEELVSGLGPALGLLLSLAPAVLAGQTPPPTATAHAVSVRGIRCARSLPRIVLPWLAR